jgi:predicted nucleic-acid-binding protein
MIISYFNSILSGEDDYIDGGIMTHFMINTVKVELGQVLMSNQPSNNSLIALILFISLVHKVKRNYKFSQEAQVC